MNCLARVSKTLKQVLCEFDAYFSLFPVNRINWWVSIRESFEVSFLGANFNSASFFKFLDFFLNYQRNFVFAFFVVKNLICCAIDLFTKMWISNITSKVMNLVLKYVGDFHQLQLLVLKTYHMVFILLNLNLNLTRTPDFWTQHRLESHLFGDSHHAMALFKKRIIICVIKYGKKRVLYLILASYGFFRGNKIQYDWICRLNFV